MADDSWDIDTVMDFHPCDRPHGMRDYVLTTLTTDQQAKLNDRKREQIRTDQKYLAAHPEIRGLIIMILRLLMKTKPKYDIYEVVGKYFTKPYIDLKEEVNAYLDERAQILSDKSLASVTPQKELSLSTYLEQVGEDFGEDQPVQEGMETPVLLKEDNEEKMTTILVEEISTTSSEKICREVIYDIVENVQEELDITSVGTIASVGFPVDYEDHAIESPSEDSFD